MNSLLLVIDLQNSFINKKTRDLPLKIEKLIKCNKFDLVSFTRFINSSDSKWYTKLNFKGCLNDNEREIVIDTKTCKIFDKCIYTALNDEFIEYIKNNSVDKIYLCGLDTDACVYKTAVDLFEHNYNVYVLKDYCMSTAGVRVHKNAINNLKRLIGNESII